MTCERVSRYDSAKQELAETRAGVRIHHLQMGTPVPGQVDPDRSEAMQGGAAFWESLQQSVDEQP